MFIYVREAHPGERVGHHTSLDDKLAKARLLRDEVGIRRPILVDDLEGTGHLAYGALPNMTWVIARGGQIVYKSDWTNAMNIEAFVRRYQEARRRKPPRGSIAPYYSEQLEYHDVDREAFYAHLRRCGESAYTEFKHAEKLWRERSA